MNISNDLKKLLEETGITLRELSRASGVDLNSLYKIYNSKMKNSTIDRLIPYIYGDKRPPKIPEEFRKRKKPSE